MTYLWIAPLLFTIFIWWLSTGLILKLHSLPRSSYQAIFGVSVLVLLLALWGLKISSGQATMAGAYCSFTCAILIWGWQELAFLLGYITGSRRSECPMGVSGLKRAWYAFQTINYHELALVSLGLILFFINIDAVNQTGFWTFLILWGMRQSTKINVFLGVLNFNESFLPQHLKYLVTYFRRRAMNLLMPFSILLSVLLLVLIWPQFTGDTSQFEMTSSALLATLLALGLLEHLFLILPFPSELLWKWGYKNNH
ncbi:putative photosynthetic complex assembly protein PuhE [Polynucleobacter antarcticus]|uniref:Photosynthetic complex assembly protein 2 n=1 Tax=Polynucleobacter antarcticus TaxID=1743162 RepID=A0A6M9PRM9_9BURK|nr:putative photosynthetic complex assembly protein PuhE [Polynucleobacter antarcticus]QKM62188.1 photosynthetic complex assembly protein 2 [Polynucleobacter antarcticus]